MNLQEVKNSIEQAIEDMEKLEEENDRFWGGTAAEQQQDIWYQWMKDGKMINTELVRSQNEL